LLEERDCFGEQQLKGNESRLEYKDSAVVTIHWSMTLEALKLRWPFTVVSVSRKGPCHLDIFTLKSLNVDCLEDKTPYFR
jgi:hypothetical protein